MVAGPFPPLAFHIASIDSIASGWPYVETPSAAAISSSRSLLLIKESLPTESGSMSLVRLLRRITCSPAATDRKATRTDGIQNGPSSGDVPYTRSPVSLRCSDCSLSRLWLTAFISSIRLFDKRAQAACRGLTSLLSCNAVLTVSAISSKSLLSPSTRRNISCAIVDMEAGLIHARLRPVSRWVTIIIASRQSMATSYTHIV